MTQIEESYNQGVEDACLILEAALKSIPKGHAITISGLADLARDMRQNLTISDDTEEVT